MPGKNSYSSSASGSSSGGGTVPNSPFFAPNTPSHVVLVTQTTPGGTRRQLPTTVKDEVQENKSGLVGCVANLMNAIVGSGIVGIPYAVQQAGFCAGIFLIILCAIITETSLRLLIATAKHVHVPSYETAAEAAFGRIGFKFVAINMFIMAYGAMLSYLMVVKDSFSAVLGIAADDYPLKRAVLFAVSIGIMVPLSSQRDMADLAKTSRLSVVIDSILVALVVYNAPIVTNLQKPGAVASYFEEIVHPSTVFIGLGVLSFAYVCQHSAFIIAGSLQRPTIKRWSTVTSISLTLCAILALTCGLSGYIGYGAATKGNILLNLDPASPSANVARAMLGTTMLFVYPLESFVARHVCVVLLFAGRRAHEGDDSAILNRRDRRIGLTAALYLLAVIPAALFEDMGPVLAITGAVGGSCMSYIGPGALFMGIHGGRFIELIESSWLGSVLKRQQKQSSSSTLLIANQIEQPTVAVETTPLVASAAQAKQIVKAADKAKTSVTETENCFVYAIKLMVWYLLGMPFWCSIAKQGKRGLTAHIEEMALKSPHPIRIGDVEYRRVPVNKAGRVLTSYEGSDDNDPEKVAQLGPSAIISRENSLPLIAEHAPGSAPHSQLLNVNIYDGNESQSAHGATGVPVTNVNQQIGQRLLQQQKENQQHLKRQDLALEADPQAEPPTLKDFGVAIFLFLFGVLAFVAGVISLFIR